ncbi:MAG: hypothetical protein A2427_02340 [Candidatus Nealsonbacteria bacterium RIFOXYC1_FULL_40_7]|uniref:Uncharacterized protein n=1 Tax=Candidatus Nealsonbacteria bacterium RIFOXYC1_FULL_40_7 TaxID=1801678 RepID=A0A1G2ET84_9BACT|nr:MAG: hypothetical protein A2427_02340 [Candidatus Nealsonbacteria bacterium RIFOXYC1_FULL_40_7]
MQHIFPIFKKVWNEADGDWLETDEILYYEALDTKGAVIARAETPADIEATLVSSYLEESNADNTRKIKLDPKMFRKKVSQRY